MVILLITIVVLAVGRKPTLSHVLVLTVCRPTAVYLPRAAFRCRRFCSPWWLLRCSRARLAKAERCETVVSLRAFFSRWKEFGARMGELGAQFVGTFGRLVVIGGLAACSHRGQSGSTGGWSKV